MKMNFLTKLVFYWKKPPIIAVCGKERVLSAQAIYQVLSRYLKIKKFEIEEEMVFSINSLFQNKAFLVETDLKNPEDLIELFKKSRLPILVISDVDEIPNSVLRLVKELPSRGILILNSDNKIPAEIKSECPARIFTFGFEETSLFRASDVKLNDQGAEPLAKDQGPVLGINFKINYKGNIVPVWLTPTPNFGVEFEERCSSLASPKGSAVGKEHIYAALTAAAVGTALNLNLVEISQALKAYQGLPKA